MERSQLCWAHATGKEASRRTCPVLCSGEDITTGEGNWDALLLDWTGLLEPFLVNAHEKLPLEQVVLKIVTLRFCDILLARKMCVGFRPQSAHNLTQKAPGLHPEVAPGPT